MRELIFLVSIVMMLGGAQSAIADPPERQAQPGESIGSGLLDNLPRTMPQPAPSQAPDDVGEDLGQPAGPLALVRVQREMAHAESLLASQITPEAADVQTRILKQLDELIAELAKQCQGAQCQSGGQPQPQSQPQPVQQPKPGGGGSSAGTSAVRNADPRLQAGDAARAEPGDIEALTKKLWGHLPERDREQMLQSFSEEFLPQYELEIQQYYRRLSDERDAAADSLRPRP